MMLLEDFLLQGKMLVKDFRTEGRSERGKHKLRLHKMFSNNKSQAKAPGGEVPPFSTNKSPTYSRTALKSNSLNSLIWLSILQKPRN